MKRLSAAFVVIGLGLAAGALGMAQSNPFAGTWKLNLAKSTFDPGPAPRSQTRTWTADGKVSVEGVNAAGAAVAYGYTLSGDGTASPTTGSVPNAADAVSSKHIEAGTIEATFTRRGALADTTRFAISADGKLLTVTAKGTRPDGGALNDLLVYDKQ